MVEKTFMRFAPSCLAAVGLLGAFAYSRRTRGHDQVDPELRSVMTRFRAPTYGPKLVALMLPLGRLATRCVDGVSVETRHIEGPEGQPLTVAIYRPDDLKPGRGAMLYSHGGGFIGGSIGSHQTITSGYARDLGIVVVSVSYRLAPQHPFPAPLDDVLTAYSWLTAAAQDLDIDAAKIVVAGDSAGGCLTAGLCQRLHDAGDPAPVLQLLVYPALDDRTAVDPPDDDTGQITWTRGSNLFAWSAYLGHRPGGAAQAYAAPAHRADLSGLPPAWIGVGTLDLFHREDVDYARRLTDAGVACELVEIAGGYHGFDTAHPTSAAARRFRGSALEAVRRALDTTSQEQA